MTCSVDTGQNQDTVPLALLECEYLYMIFHDMIGIYWNARQCTATKSKAKQNSRVPGASRQQTTKKTAQYKLE